jgi:hypothetical protein
MDINQIGENGDNLEAEAKRSTVDRLRAAQDEYIKILDRIISLETDSIDSDTAQQVGADYVARQTEVNYLNARSLRDDSAHIDGAVRSGLTATKAEPILSETNQGNYAPLKAYLLDEARGVEKTDKRYPINPVLIKKLAENMAMCSRRMNETGPRYRTPNPAWMGGQGGE